MRFTLEGRTVDRPYLWLVKGAIEHIDQRMLPGRTEVVRAASLEDQVVPIWLVLSSTPSANPWGMLAIFVQSTPKAHKAYGEALSSWRGARAV